MRADPNGPRVLEPDDTEALAYGQIKAIATGDPDFLTLADLEDKLARLERLQRGHHQEQAALARQEHDIETNITDTRAKLAQLQAPTEHLAARPQNDPFDLHVAGRAYTKRTDAIRALAASLRLNRAPRRIMQVDLGGTLLPVQAAPGHRSSAPAAVLPVIAKDQAIYVQLRRVDPQPAEPRQRRKGLDHLVQPVTGGLHDPQTVERERHLQDGPALNSRPPSYISVSGAVGNPRVGLYRPPQRLHPEILVTEGILDALSANAAGYRAAAVLSPGSADADVAVHLSRLQAPLILALDPDDAGERATDRLMHHLTARGRRPARLEALAGDLNEALVESHDWPRKLTAHVRHAVASGPSSTMPAL